MNQLYDQGLWPFVKAMCIHLAAEILQSGLILVDLPGFGDANQAHEAVAVEYQRRCDEIFIVTRIQRSVDCAFVERTVEDYCAGMKDRMTSEQHKAGTTLRIICTHAADLAKPDRTQLTAYVTKTANRARLEAAENRYEEDYTSDGLDRFQLKNAIDLILIEERNSRVKGALHEKYDPILPEGASLLVFCVDSSWSLEPESEDARLGSGVPNLQEFASDLPLSRMLQKADTYLTGQIPALVTSFKLWVDSSFETHTKSVISTAARLPDIRIISGLTDSIEQWKLDVIEEFFPDIILPPTKDDRDIEGAATKTIEKWKTEVRHPASVQAWFRHDGTHKTEAVGARCWNLDLALCLKPIDDMAWKNLVDRVQKELSTTRALIEKKVQKFKTEASKVCASGTFSRNLNSRKSTLLMQWDLEVDSLAGKLAKIQRDATTGCRTSYMRQVMLPTYQTGKFLRGRGVVTRRYNLLLDRVTGKEFVGDYYALARQAVVAAITDTAQKLSQRVESTIGAIEQNFEKIKLAHEAAQRKKRMPASRISTQLQKELKAALYEANDGVYKITKYREASITGKKVVTKTDADDMDD